MQTSSRSITSIKTTTVGGGGVGDTGAFQDALDTLTMRYDAGGSYGKSVGTSIADGTSRDLRSYRQRIDASVEQQKEQADLMAELQRKVIEYRRRFTEIEGQLASKRLTDPTLKMLDVPELGTVKDELMWESKSLRNLDDAMQVQLVNALNDERRRIEEYRSQLEQERLQNQNMQAELQRLHQQYEFNMMNQEKIFRNREKNLARHLSEEQKKMMDVWVELQQVRKQCADFKEQTERDLENQKNEFIKVINNVSNVSRHVTVEESVRSLVKSDEDSVLLDVVKRFREGGATSEDAELYNDILQKYEKAVERIIELEARGEDDSKIALLELELKRARETIADHQSTFQKIYEMANESDRNTPTTQPRARSQSPGTLRVTPPETLRKVRLALRSLDNENNQLLKKLKNAEMQISELNSKYEATNSLRLRLDKQLTLSKQEIAKQMKDLDNAAREMKRLEQNIRNVEEERDVAEVARKRLEDEVRRLNEILSQTQPGIDMETLQNAEEKNRVMQKDFERRISELTRRIEVISDDNKRLKNGVADAKDQFKIVETQLDDTLRKLDDKDAAYKQLDGVKRMLAKDLDTTRARLDAVVKENDTLKSHVDKTKKDTDNVEITLQEIRLQKDEAFVQKDDFYRQMVDAKRRLDDEVKQREDLEKANIYLRNEIDMLKNKLKDYEDITLEIRRQNEQLGTQDKIGQTKLVAMETKIRVNEKQLQSLGDANNQLRVDKQDILNQKAKLDKELEDLRDQLRKLDSEVDKYKKRNAELSESERVTAEKFKSQTDKIYHLEKELEDANNEVDELKRRLQRLDRDQEERVEYSVKLKSVAPDEAPKTETVHTHEITKIHIQEAEKWKDDAQRLEAEKDSLIVRLRTLEDELADKKGRIDDLIRQLNKIRAEEEAKSKFDLENLQRKWQNDFDDEKELYNKNLDAVRAIEEDLRARLSSVELKLEQANIRGAELEKDANDWKDKWNTVIVELQKARDDLDAGLTDSTKEIQRWKSDAFEARSDLKVTESNLESLRAQLASANDRCFTLNKTVSDQDSRIRDLEANVSRLEEDVADAKALARQHEADLDSTINKLRNLEGQYSQLQIDNRQLRSEIESLQRDNDLLQATNNSYENEIDELKRRLEQAVVKANEYERLLDELRKERDGIQNVFVSKKVQVEQLTQLSQTFDDRLNRAKQDAADAADKLFAADAERNAQRAEILRLQQELTLYKQQLTDKSNEYHLALTELTDAHRGAEEGRLNAVHDLETRKYEIDDLQSRLSITEQRLIALQKEFTNADAERDMLLDALRRLHTLSARGVAISRFEKILAGRDGEDVIDEEGHPSGTDVEKLKIVKSITDDRPDAQETESNIQKLIARLEQADRERVELRAALARLKRKTSDSTLSLSKQETRFQTIEEKYTYVEEQRRSVEARLTSAKQLLRSQEEALKQRDDERKQLKAKIVAMELESRTSDAQNRHLNDMVRNLKTELDKAQSDVRSIRDREVYREISKTHTELKSRDEGDAQRLSLLVANFDSERQTLNDSLRKVSNQLQQSEVKCADLTDELDRMRRELAKAESNEADLKRTIDQHTRISYEMRALKDQLSSTQSELSSAQSRKQQLESEISGLRADLRDQRQRLNESSSRISDLQRQLQDSQSDKNRLSDKISSLEKSISTQRITESDLRQQLSSAVGNSKGLQRDLDDLQRRFTKSESDRQSLTEKIEDLGRIRLGMQKRIEVLEVEKHNIEALMAETALQREGIEHSLGALERENKELYRNCVSLQQQIAQLEMDNGQRLVQLTMKQQDDHDRYVKSVSSEKVHIEKMIDSRERALKNQVKQLEGQVSRLRDQLDAERRQRRSLADRFIVGDFPKIGGTNKSTVLRTSSSYADMPYPLSSPFDYYSTDLLSSSSYGGYRGAGTSKTFEGTSDFSTIKLKDSGGRSDGFTTSVHMPGGTKKEETGTIQPKVELDESGREGKRDDKDRDRRAHEKPTQL